jgi:hypothetical protein
MREKTQPCGLPLKGASAVRHFFPSASGRVGHRERPENLNAARWAAAKKHAEFMNRIADVHQSPLEQFLRDYVTARDGEWD